MQINTNPSKSTRQIYSDVDVSSHTPDWRELKKSGFKCYKIHISQKLQPGDPERRLEFCDWLQRRPDFPAFLENVIWTDESTFTNCGIFNRNNEHIWSINNPRQFREIRPQVRFSLNVWAGIYKNRILGPHFFNGILNGETYQQFLTSTFEDYLDDLPLANYNSVWFQHDGAPPHNTGVVSDYLTRRFGDRWIGNNGPVRWPARSPDLSVLDTFLWGTLKNRIYGQGEYQNIEELRFSIIREFGRLRRREINRAVHNIRRRLVLCSENHGQHFEHLL